MTSPVPLGSRYVAMGSSYAAGPGLRPRSPGSPLRAARSAGNYAHLLAERLQLDLTDVSYTGATAAEIVNGVSRRPAQIDAVTAATELVTLTCGGNDVGYIGRLTLSSLPAPARALPPIRRRITEAGKAVEARFAKLGDVFDRLLGVVHDRAPQATIVLVDYLTLLPADGVPTPPLPPEVATWGRRMHKRLTEETAAAATRHGCLLLAASSASRDHHAWASYPWTTGFELGRDKAIYHPNHAGMRAVADLVAEAIR